MSDNQTPQESGGVFKDGFDPEGKFLGVFAERIERSIERLENDVKEAREDAKASRDKTTEIIQKFYDKPNIKQLSINAAIVLVTLLSAIIVGLTGKSSLERNFDTHVSYLQASIISYEGKVDKLSERLDSIEVRLGSIELAIQSINSKLDSLAINADKVNTPDQPQESFAIN